MSSFMLFSICASYCTLSDTASDLQMLDLLYGDQETTSDNIVSEMRTAAACQSVTAAVANLYLRKQVIFERACA